MDGLTTPPRHIESGLRPATHLRDEHEQLERLLSQLSEYTDSCDAGRLQETWSKLENCLSSHLQTEEQQLLPSFLASNPDEVRSILTEHRRIRELVAELGVAVDLHTARKDAVLRLVRLLREHAPAEDRSLYGWLRQGR